jgi:hypothetical protein
MRTSGLWKDKTEGKGLHSRKGCLSLSGLP